TSASALFCSANTNVTETVVEQDGSVIDEVRDHDLARFAERHRAAMRTDDPHNTQILVEVEAAPLLACEADLDRLLRVVTRDHRNSEPTLDEAAACARHQVTCVHDDLRRV